MKKQLSISFMCIILWIGLNHAVCAQNNKVILDGLYATSTELPFEDYGVQNAFDGDPSTIWKTIKGAGPEEGIMIYFSEPTYITKIEVHEAEGDGLSKLESFEIYGDGKSIFNAELEEELSSLYLKMGRTNSTRTISDSVDGKAYLRYEFDQNKSVGISEIIFYKGEEKLDVVLPYFVKGTITSTSSLSPDLAYGPANLMDSRKEFGWAEGQGGNGKGVKITFSAEKELSISSLKIWNGYQRSPKHFSSNSRLKNFQFGLPGQMKTFSIADETDPQSIELGESIKGKRFELVIGDAYAGAKYADLVISELKFYDGDRPVVIETDTRKKNIRELKSKKHPLLDQYLDKNIKVSLSFLKEENGDGRYYSEYYGKLQSLILRSNNTFVLYTNENKMIDEYRKSDDYSNYEEENKNLIADGNWEIKELSDGSITVRIFGKIFSPTTTAELYKGDVTSGNVRIFQDILTLTKDKISGQRFVDDMLIKH